MAAPRTENKPQSTQKAVSSERKIPCAENLRAISRFCVFEFLILNFLRSAVPRELKKCLMHSGVGRKFRMERRSHQISLAYQHGIVTFTSQDFNLASDMGDLGCANEYGLQRLATERPLELANKAVDLPAIGVALNRDVHHAEALLRGVTDFGSQKDCARTGSESRARAHELCELLQKAGLLKVPQKCAGFATRNDQCIKLIQLLRLAHQHHFSAQFLQAAAMRIKVAL